MSKLPIESRSISEDSIEEFNISTFVGLQIRERRRFLGMTIAELAAASRISVSNLSKIENAQVSPSLQSVDSLAAALGTPVSSLFRGFRDEGQLFHIAKGKGMLMARPGKSGGHIYELLAQNTGQVQSFQPFLVTLVEQNTERATFTNNGMELVYVLEGALTYRYGTRTIELAEGDTLIFDGRTPHGPEKILRSPARFLAVLMQPGELSSPD